MEKQQKGGNMITISVCMIVKNEEDKLGICLDSLKTIADEIIIVDTGSTDKTKELAAKYTDKIYDFAWTGSFSDARNFAFSKASCDYIYSADADEELDSENIKKFEMLKEIMDQQIDIVQMYYCNQLENNTIYSFDRELRPKLYKRLREFVWQETIHEAVRLEPVIYDSEIDIIHRPGEGHAVRDLKAFERLIETSRESVDGDDIGAISKRLVEIYAKELIIAGEKENFEKACAFFTERCELATDKDELAICLTMAARCCYEMDDVVGFMKYALRAAAGELMTSELCCNLGAFYENIGDVNEAAMWYYNAANEVAAYLDIRCQEEIPQAALERLQE